jgi:hypothetical protein
MRAGRNGGKLKSGNTVNVGRHKKLPQLDELMAEVLGEEKDGRNAAQVILAALRAKAARGDVKAAALLLDRAYGKPKETLEQNLTISKPIIIDWQGDDNNT